jgi:Domain of unknown function (DUF4292)
MMIRSQSELGENEKIANSTFRYPVLFHLAWPAIIITIFISLGSCRSAKKLQTAISKKDTVVENKVVVSEADLKADSIRFIADMLHRINSKHINFKTFSAKVKVNFEGFDGKNYDFNAFIRIQKDHVIWVLINAVLGIEAFRIMITPDSVKVLNRLDKVVQLRSVNYLKEVAHLPVDFQTLQDLLVGNPIFLDSSILFYRKDEKGISLMSMGDLFRNYITLNPADFTVIHSKLDDVDVMRSRTCDITFGDFEWKDSVRFSTYRKISVAEKTKLDVQLGFKQFNFNDNLSFPFSIPKNYKRK